MQININCFSIFILLSISINLWSPFLRITSVNSHIWNNSHKLKVISKWTIGRCKLRYDFTRGNWSKSPTTKSVFPAKVCHNYNQILHINADVWGNVIFETNDISLIITTWISLNIFLSSLRLQSDNFDKFLDRQFIGIFNAEWIVMQLMFIADTPVGANKRTFFSQSNIICKIFL